MIFNACFHWIAPQFKDFLHHTSPSWKCVCSLSRLLGHSSLSLKPNLASNQETLFKRLTSKNLMKMSSWLYKADFIFLEERWTPSHYDQFLFQTVFAAYCPGHITVCSVSQALSVQHDEALIFGSHWLLQVDYAWLTTNCNNVFINVYMYLHVYK